MSNTKSKFEDEFAPEESANTKGINVGNVVDTKEGLTTAAKALGQGKMPTTEQITEALDTVQDSSALRSEVNLSSTGQRVADRVDSLIDSTKQLVVEKNEGDVIQRLIHHAKLASQELDAEAPNVQGETQDAEKLLKRAYNEMLVLSKLTVSSNDFRGVLSDVYNLLRDILQDNNVPGAEHIPAAEELTDKDGKLDTEKAKKAAQKGANKAADDVYDQLDEDSKRKVDQARKADPEDAKRLASSLLDQAAQKAGQAVKPVADKAARGDTKEAGDHAKKQADKAGSQAQGVYNEAKQEASKLQSQAQGAMDQAGQTLESIKEDLKLTEEQREQLVDRLVGILDEVQNNKEAQRALNIIMDVLSGLQKNAKTIADKVKNKVDTEVNENDNLQEAVRNAKRAVENFAGGQSLDKLIERLYEFTEMVEKDQELGKVMHQNHEFLVRSLKDNKFVHQKDYTDKATERVEHTRDLLLKKYKKPVRSILDEAQNINRGLREDPTTNKVVKDLEGLTRDLFLDNSGKPTIKYDLLQDFQKFVPVLAKRLELLEIPRISEQDEDNEYILDNIKLSCSNIVPKTVRVRTDTEFDTEEERISNVVSVKMQGIQAQAREVAFYYKRKVLLMNMEDAGLVDVAIPNEGMDIFLKLAPAVISQNPADKNNPDNQRAFRVLESRCRVNEINIKFQHTKFGPIYKLLNKVIQSNIKREIEKMVGDGVRSFFEGVETMVSKGNQLSTGQTSNEPSKPLDSRPDGWKSEAFDVSK